MGSPQGVPNLVSVIVSSWGNHVSVDMVFAVNMKDSSALLKMDLEFHTMGPIGVLI